MSRLSKKPIEIREGVTVKDEGAVITVTGPNGELKVPVLQFISVKQEEGKLTVSAGGSAKQARMNEGTMYSLLANAIIGVTDGFSKKLEINGTGYRAELDGKTLVLSLGFAHPIRFNPPESVELKTEKNTVTVSGPNKELVGRAAAQIRAFKKPEPYKGKGIKYSDEVIIRKAGKKAATTGA